MNFLCINFFICTFLVGVINLKFSWPALYQNNDFITTDHRLNTVSENGVLSFIKNVVRFKRGDLAEPNLARELGYKKSIKEAFSDYLGFDVALTRPSELLNLLERRTGVKTDSSHLKPHVVIVVNERNVESLNGEKGYFFKRFVRSHADPIDCLLTMITNIPYRSERISLSEGKYLQTPLTSSSNKMYQQNGYETTFMYTDSLRYRGIGKYMKVQGFHNVIGDNELVKKEGHKEKLYFSIWNRLEKAKRPQFIVAMRGRNENQLSLSNEILAKFNEISKKQKLILVIAGRSQGAKKEGYKETEILRKHLVPLYISVPSELEIENVDLSKNGSHEDIMTTLYNLSFSNKPYLSFGEDLFASSEGYSINYEFYASSRGIIKDNLEYVWKEIPYNEKKSVPSFLKNLRRHYRSSLSLADFYLKKMYLESQAVKRP